MLSSKSTIEKEKYSHSFVVTISETLVSMNRSFTFYVEDKPKIVISSVGINRYNAWITGTCFKFKSPIRISLVPQLAHSLGGFLGNRVYLSDENIRDIRAFLGLKIVREKGK